MLVARRLLRGTKARGGGFEPIMASDPKTRPPAPQAVLSTGAGEPMSAEQAATLKQLSIDAYEPEAFDEHMTRSEAERRIVTLKAKLKLLDAPPHTL